MQYSKLVDVYEKLESTSKRLEKTVFAAKLLKETDTKLIPVITLMIQGKIYPAWDDRKIGVAAKLVLKAINLATGIEAEKVEQEWKKTGDLGKTAENLVEKKQQQSLFRKDLEVRKVFDNLEKLSSMEGAGTVSRKIQLIAELLTSASPKEAKYIIKTVLEEMRIGVGEGVLRDAIVWEHFGYTGEEGRTDEVGEEYKSYLAKVQEAYDITNDFSEVAIASRKGEKGLGEIKLLPEKPIKVMLAQKVDDVAAAFEKVGKPAFVEYKYDGFRMQVHGFDGKIRIFTRRLEDVTEQFPEVIEYLKKNVKAKSFILDGEAVGYNPQTKKYLPFQKVSQRIKRKYEIERMAKEYPIELNLFDIVFLDGKNLIKKEFSERRKLLEKIITEKKWNVVLAKQLISGDEKEVQQFYEDTLKLGMEGVMFKKSDAPYKPGSRVGHMVKLKPVMESLDVIITGAEWGEGKRASWITSFAIACQDESGEFVEIGKVSTGLKELESDEGTTFSEMTELLKPLIISEKGRELIVKPEVIIEVHYEEIQKSPTYSSGYALRFPRFVRLRDDKSIDEVSDISLVEELYYAQKKRR